MDGALKSSTGEIIHSFASSNKSDIMPIDLILRASNTSLDDICTCYSKRQVNVL